MIGIIAGFAACFLLGMAAALLADRLLGGSRKRRSGGRTQNKQAGPAEKKPGLLDRIGTMNIVLVLVGAAVLLFTLKMIELYELTGGIPDTLVQCFYSMMGFECGILGWIKTAKEKHRERKRRREDAENAPPQDGGPVG
ncbi:hypothetical protein [uncultured Dysosmobacter sp.]|uniref:hypothetical protein n=1 Tax=uncultured Dysosmobacter sp. TaxID=2591384 RepID=UPI00261992DF|nr:hypothetical protein [uncultured Dysosmobacter sp.]